MANMLKRWCSFKIGLFHVYTFWSLLCMRFFLRIQWYYSTYAKLWSCYKHMHGGYYEHFYCQGTAWTTCMDFMFILLRRRKYCPDWMFSLGGCSVSLYDCSRKITNLKVSLQSAILEWRESSSNWFLWTQGSNWWKRECVYYFHLTRNL